LLLLLLALLLLFLLPFGDNSGAISLLTQFQRVQLAKGVGQGADLQHEWMDVAAGTATNRRLPWGPGVGGTNMSPRADEFFAGDAMCSGVPARNRNAEDSQVRGGSAPKWGSYTPPPSRPQSQEARARRRRSPSPAANGSNGAHFPQDVLRGHLEAAEQALKLHHQRALQAVAGLSEESGKVSRLVSENMVLRAALIAKEKGLPSRPVSPVTVSAASVRDGAFAWAALQRPESKPALPPLPVFPSPPRLPIEDDCGQDSDRCSETQYTDGARQKKCYEASGDTHRSAPMLYGFAVLEIWRREDQHGLKVARATTVKTAKKIDNEIEGILGDRDFDSSANIAAANTSSKACPCVISPSSPRRSCWDIISLVLVIWDLFMIPMGLFALPETMFLTVADWITRIFWTMDMPLSFISGYVTHSGSIEMRPSRIIRKYLRTWFCLDLVVVGVDWLEVLMSAFVEGLGFARLGKVSRAFRVVRMVRLLRLARMTEVLNLLIERINSEKVVIILDIMKLLILMIGGGHLMACLWYAVGTAESDKNWLTESGYIDSSLGFKYMMSLRWAMSQFAGGMDEVTPVSMYENIYGICVFLTSFWCGAVFLSIMTSSMTQWYIVGSQTSQQLVSLRRYLGQNKISNKLTLRVQRNAQHAMAEHQRIMPEGSVLLIKKVSEPLRVELHYEMYSPILSVHPFFVRYMEECPHVIRKVCHQAMEKVNVSLGDTIFNIGEIPSKPKMLIVMSGRLLYTPMVADKSYVNEGQWISEAPLWVNWVHRGLLVAMQESQLCVLSVKEFHKIAEQFEHADFNPRDYAYKFAEGLNNMGGEVNDLAGCNEDFASKIVGTKPRKSLPFGSRLPSGLRRTTDVEQHSTTQFSLGEAEKRQTSPPSNSADSRSVAMHTSDSKEHAPNVQQSACTANSVPPMDTEALPGSTVGWLADR